MNSAELQEQLFELQQRIDLYEARYQDILVKREAVRAERNALIVAYAQSRVRRNEAA